MKMKMKTFVAENRNSLMFSALEYTRKRHQKHEHCVARMDYVAEVSTLCPIFVGREKITVDLMSTRH